MVKQGAISQGMILIALGPGHAGGWRRSGILLRESTGQKGAQSGLQVAVLSLSRWKEIRKFFISEQRVEGLRPK
jgi:hypothetical protein